MKKIITIISILLLISLSACSDSSSGMGPNNPTETYNYYTHTISVDRCTEYADVYEFTAQGEEKGKCPEEYSVHCEKIDTGEHTEQHKWLEGTSESVCNYY